MARQIGCSVYRGGQSKTLIFRDEDLPRQQDERDALFLRAIGSPDPTRLNGLGGVTVNQNKVIVVKKPEDDSVDIVYTLGQVSLNQPQVEYSYNGGNIAFAVALYAAHHGMAGGRQGGETVRLYNTNTDAHLRARILRVGREPGGADIELDFLSPGGNVTGRLFPTGQLSNHVLIEGKTFDITVIDAGNLTALVGAEELGLDGTETLEAQVQQVVPTLEAIGEMVGSMLGQSAGLIKTILIAPPRTYSARSGLVARADMTLCARDITLGNFHPGFPVTGAIAVGIAVRVPGTLAHRISPMRELAGPVRIGTPAGITEIGACVTRENHGYAAQTITLVDSARCLIDGTIWVA